MPALLIVLNAVIKLFAPDGALCDAAIPCGQDKRKTLPTTGNDCCAYKQGDGDVPHHDWTFEETLSALVMTSEQILVGRNASAAEHYLPLFMRTSDLLETRRDPAQNYNVFLTGPSSNLLAPSFGGGAVGQGYGGWSHLAGVSITYITALDRLIECAKLVNQSSFVDVFAQRRNLTMEGLGTFLEPNKEYFVRSWDPNGTLHGYVRS